MSDKSFEKAMSQIAAEANAEQQSELEAQRRQRMQTKLRRFLMLVFGLALLA